ncbi:lipid kinase, YegS/Rv2252/BmrU family [Seinonella peptonophila]|uniref:Lipid kinase, YegS/Rv2252/BmrU family n=1 Tax=Seinonella peptonophila TaxID=112248 RepID=A0A1M5B136_9BACL|nr:diacylglycerol kinase family protein [Seinonella peptonophila]SHF36224.1 lipid kinase, YegS/Rv2252/BmrU family [Seinonella peptonophila]
MDTIALIINSNAGNQSLREDLPYIVNRLQHISTNVTLHYTEKPGDGKRIIDEIASDVDLLIAIGGDGTVHECVNALAHQPNRPLFAILPGGTCNDFTRALGISQDHRLAVEQILDLRTRHIDIGSHNGNYFLNFWGIGCITQVSQQIHKGLKKDWGRLAYYLSALQTISDPQRFEISIQTDTFNYQDEVVMMIVGNGSYLGGMTTFFPRSSVVDGLLDVLIIRDLSIDLLWSLLESRIMDQLPTGSDLAYFHCNQLEVQSNPSLLIDCDGEKLHHTPSKIQVHPRYLEMVVGDFTSG